MLALKLFALKLIPSVVNLDSRRKPGMFYFVLLSLFSNFEDICFFNQCYLLKLALNMNGLCPVQPDNICSSKALQYETIFPESTDFCTAGGLQCFLSIYTYHLTSQT